MPTVLRHGPYRFYFYSNDADEPVHVHVERDGDVAKVWADPVRVQRRFLTGGDPAHHEAGAAAPRTDHGGVG